MASGIGQATGQYWASIEMAVAELGSGGAAVAGNDESDAANVDVAGSDVAAVCDVAGWVVLVCDSGGVVNLVMGSCSAMDSRLGTGRSIGIVLVVVAEHWLNSLSFVSDRYH